jgi:hypothetical protein
MGAAAMLGEIVESVAEKSEVKINSLQLNSDSSQHSVFAAIAVRITGEGDIIGLTAFMQAIEQHEHPMLVRELSVSSTNPAASADRIEVLHFDVVIEALAATARGEHAGPLGAGETRRGGARRHR